MRLITIAKGELITADSVTLQTVTFHTDPLPLAPDDRVTAFWRIHYMYGPNTPLCTWVGQVSNDGGVNWAAATTLGDSVAIPVTTPVTRFVSAPAHGAVIRFRTEFDVAGATPGGGAVKYDLHMLFDHA